jgi:hypothetical protein
VGAVVSITEAVGVLVVIEISPLKLYRLRLPIRSQLGLVVHLTQQIGVITGTTRFLTPAHLLVVVVAVVAVLLRQMLTDETAALVAVGGSIVHPLLEPTAQATRHLHPHHKAIMAALVMLEVVATTMQRVVVAGVLAALAQMALLQSVEMEVLELQTLLRVLH